MKKGIFGLWLLCCLPLCVWAGNWAKDTTCVLSTQKALDYCNGDIYIGGYSSGQGCCKPWSKQGVAYFGYEPVDEIEVSWGGGKGVFAGQDYCPEMTVWGSIDNATFVEMFKQHHKDHSTHTYTIKNIPANFRYFRFRFSRAGSAGCGTSNLYHIYATRTNAFNLTKGETVYTDKGDVHVKTNVEENFKLKLSSVRMLSSGDKDVVLKISGSAVASGCLRVEELLFNKFEVDAGRPSYYRLPADTNTGLSVKFNKSGTYTLMLELSQGDCILQRRAYTFYVSD